MSSEGAAGGRNKSGAVAADSRMSRAIPSGLADSFRRPAFTFDLLGHSSSHLLVIAAVVLSVVWFGMLGTYRLLDPDEGRYAEIPREMIASGDWVTPHLNGLKYLEKPPLQYWATAIAFSVFGQHEWTARIWTALTGFLGILLIGSLGARIYGRNVGLIAAAVQAGSLFYAVLGHVSTLDMGLCFGLQASLTGMVLLVHAPDRRAQVQASLTLAVGVALAFLSKGLVGIAIPVCVAALYVAVTRDWKFILHARPWWTITVLLLLAAPWIIAAADRNPEFLRYFFVHEHFQRFLSRVHDRYEPVWFFIPILLVGFMPWTPFLPEAMRNAWRACRAGDRVATLLGIWSLFILLFFSVSQSKLIPYILPLFPALALLTARSLATMTPWIVARYLYISCAIWSSIAIVGIVLYLTSVQLEIRAGDATVGFLLALLIAALMTAFSATLAARRNVSDVVVVASLGMLLFTAVGLHSAQHLPRHRDLITASQRIQERISDSTPVYCVNTFSHSITFYTERSCTLVGYRGELDFGLNLAPDKWIADLDRFRRRWLLEKDAVAVMTPQNYLELSRAGLPMTVIFSGSRIVAVTRASGNM